MQLTDQLEVLSAHVGQLEEQKGPSYRHSSWSVGLARSGSPPSSDGADFNPPGKENSACTGRKRGGQVRHPGGSHDLLPMEQCADDIPLFPTTCRGCGEVLSGGIENRTAINWSIAQRSSRL
jgi:hypothetical protein